MATDDTCCTIVPYFRVSAENLSAFKALCERFVAQTEQEAGCLYYGFSFDGEAAHCREGYVNAEALLAHIENVARCFRRRRRSPRSRASRYTDRRRSSPGCASRWRR